MIRIYKLLVLILILVFIVNKFLFIIFLVFERVNVKGFFRVWSFKVCVLVYSDFFNG